jgi:hypothetical protein
MAIDKVELQVILSRACLPPSADIQSIPDGISTRWPFNFVDHFPTLRLSLDLQNCGTVHHPICSVCHA